MLEKTSRLGKHFENLFSNIDNKLLIEKEQRLRAKLGNKMHDCIFTEEINHKMNIIDFSDLGLLDSSNDEVAFLFSTIFPVFIENNGVIFRLYRHKIEVDLSDEMSDRYIFIFSEGRFTSGLFQCFRLYDDEYIYGIKKIIAAIPMLRKAILDALDNLEKSSQNFKSDMNNFKSKVDLAEKNYNEVLKELRDK